MLLLDESEIERLSLSAPVPLTLHPAAVYLSSLAPGSQCTMKGSLDAIASLLTGGRCDASTVTTKKYDKRGEERKKRAVRKLKF